MQKSTLDTITEAVINHGDRGKFHPRLYEIYTSLVPHLHDFVREVKEGTPASVTAGLSRYYAITVDRLMFLFGEVGFTDVQRLDGILQPIVVGRRRTA